MKFASLEHFDVSPWRIGLLGAMVSLGLTAVAGEALGDVLGVAKVPALALIAVLVFYIVLSTPRRLLDAQRVAQARESVLLSAAATACLNVTGSRPRTVLLLRSRDPGVSQTLVEVGKRVLLGAPVPDAILRSTKSLASYSATTALQSVASLGKRPFDAGDEEARGLASSAELNRETKLPVFMTACFFTPIMLLFFAVFSHSYTPGDLVELTALEFVVLDITFYLSSGERRPR